MTDPTTSDAADGFAARVQQMHVPEPKADREVLLLWVGAGIVAVGLLLIVAGYWGASGTEYQIDQIPYALSGGGLGLALVVLGTGLILRFSLARLFRYWLARLVYEHQVQTDRTVEALGRIEALLGGAAPSSPAPAAPPAAAGRRSVDGQGSEAPRRRTEPLRAEPLES